MDFTDSEYQMLIQALGEKASADRKLAEQVQRAGHLELSKTFREQAKRLDALVRNCAGVAYVVKGRSQRQRPACLPSPVVGTERAL